MAVTEQTARRAYRALYMRDYRKRKKQEQQADTSELVTPDNPIAALAEWSETVLRVPVGHPLAGQPLRLPDYGLLFLTDALKHRYSLLSVARKNAKSAVISCYLLARLCGPLRVQGWRGGVCSVSREKASELKRQIEQIAEASGLEDLKVWKAPVIESSTGRLDILSADKNSGAAAGFDDALIDELGLLHERNRELVNGMRSAISARNGRFIALSIMGKAPFTREMLEQREDPSTCVHLYQADKDKDAALDDPEQWHRANPGLACGIKSLSYMEDEARRVVLVPSDQNDFKAQELNLPVDPGKEMICSTLDFNQCLGDAERDGHCVIAWDNGGSNSMTCFCALWPWSGRVEIYGAFAGIPNLQERGQADGVGALYQRLFEQGELEVYDGHRSTPVAIFLTRCLERLEGQTIIAAGADRCRKADSETALAQAGLDLPMVWRGQGAHAYADGSHDVRAFQKWILQHRLRVAVGRGLLAHAISESSVRHDVAGNPALEKARDKGRIDPLQSCVIACGLGAIVEAKGKPQPLRFAVVG